MFASHWEWQSCIIFCPNGMPLLAVFIFNGHLCLLIDFGKIGIGIVVLFHICVSIM